MIRLDMGYERGGVNGLGLSSWENGAAPFLNQGKLLKEHAWGQQWVGAWLGYLTFGGCLLDT